MKKIITVLIITAMAVSLAGCESKKSKKKPVEPRTPDSGISQAPPDYSAVLDTKTYDVLDIMNANDYTITTDFDSLPVAVYRKGEEMRIDVSGVSSAVIGDRFYLYISDAEKKARYAPLEPGDLESLQSTANGLTNFDLNGATVVSSGKREIPLDDFEGEYYYEELSQTIGQGKNVFTYFDESGNIVAVEYTELGGTNQRCIKLSVTKGVPEGKLTIPDDYDITEDNS